MTVTTISYRYREARSLQYQTVESTIEVTAQIEEGDVASDVVASLRNRTRRLVRADVERALTEVLGTSVEHRPVTVPAAPKTDAPKDLPLSPQIEATEQITEIALTTVAATAQPASAAGRWGTPNHIRSRS